MLTRQRLTGRYKQVACCRCVVKRHHQYDRVGFLDSNRIFHVKQSVRSLRKKSVNRRNPIVAGSFLILLLIHQPSRFRNHAKALNKTAAMLATSQMKTRTSPSFPLGELYPMGDDAQNLVNDLVIDESASTESEDSISERQQ